LSRPSPERLALLLGYHASLLADERRNRAFHRALARSVRGRDVLDIGSGSGVWAVAAARLGARRVVAVERERLLLPLIRAMAAEAGVEERVRVVGGDARKLRLPRAFDVIVSETVGDEGFEEGIVPLMAFARQRFLRPGGRLIPGALALRAAPVDAPRDGLRPRVLDDRAFRELAAHAPRIAPRGLRLLARPATLLEVDLETARAAVRLRGLHARFRVRERSRVRGLLVWVEMRLASGIRLSTREGTSWHPTLLPLGPLPRGRGEVAIELNWHRRTRHWRVSHRTLEGRVRHGDHSPLLAWGALKVLGRRH
jgi:SAM-dependent methyltransferase